MLLFRGSMKTFFFVYFFYSFFCFFYNCGYVADAQSVGDYTKVAPSSYWNLLNGPYWSVTWPINDYQWRDSLRNWNHVNVLQSSEKFAVSFYCEEGALGVVTGACFARARYQKPIFKRFSETVSSYDFNISVQPDLLGEQKLVYQAQPMNDILSLDSVILSDEAQTVVIAFSTNHDRVAGDDSDVYVLVGTFNNQSRMDSGYYYGDFEWTSPARLDANGALDSELDEKPLGVYSKLENRFYVGWTSGQTVNGAGTDLDIMFSYSDDLGVTWAASSWVNLDYATDAKADRLLSLYVGGDSGQLHALYSTTDLFGTDYDLILVSKNMSSNTWYGVRLALSTAYNLITDFTNEKVASVAVSPTNTSLVYLIYSADSTDIENANNSVNIGISYDGGNTFQGPFVLSNYDSAEDVSIVSDLRDNVVMAVWSSKKKQYFDVNEIPVGSGYYCTDFTTFCYNFFPSFVGVRSVNSNPLGTDVFYSVMTGNTNATFTVPGFPTGQVGGGWTVPRLLDETSNINYPATDTNDMGVARKPVVQTNRLGQYNVVYLSTKRRFFMPFIYNGEAFKTYDHVFLPVMNQWEARSKFLCKHGSKYIAAYCPQRAQEAVDRTPNYTSTYSVVYLNGENYGFFDSLIKPYYQNVQLNYGKSIIIRSMQYLEFKGSGKVPFILRDRDSRIILEDGAQTNSLIFYYDLTSYAAYQEVAGRPDSIKMPVLTVPLYNQYWDFQLNVAFLRYILPDLFRYTQSPPGFYLDYRECPHGYRKPNVSLGEDANYCVPCPLGKQCLWTYRDAVDDSDSSIIIPCPQTRYCGYGTIHPRACRDFYFNTSAPLGMTHAENCTTYGTPCSPGYYCPTDFMNASEHVKVFEFDATVISQKLVFPSTFQRVVNLKYFVYDAQMPIYANDFAPYVSWYQLDCVFCPSFGLPVTLGQTYWYWARLHSNANGFPITGTLRGELSVYSSVNNDSYVYWDGHPSLPFERKISAPWKFTFERSVTTVLTNPSEEISLDLSLYDNNTVQTVSVFNIACNDQLIWRAMLWDCDAGGEDGDPYAFNDTARFDYIQFTTRSDGFIPPSVADPSSFSLRINIHESYRNNGTIFQKLPPDSVNQPGSVLGSAGNLNLKVCIHFTFINGPQAMQFAYKVLPIRINVFEQCPAGKISPTGTSLGGTCTACNFGEYQPNIRSTVCLKCGKGTYADELGLAECKPCPKGSFQDSEGQTDCLPCDNGFYASTERSETCSSCPETHPRGPRNNTNISNCISAPGYFTDTSGTPVRCEQLGIDRVQCLEEGVTLETITLVPGFWRSHPTSKVVLRCLNPQFCRGGKGIANSTNSRRQLQFVPYDYCIPHHTGVLCEACEPGYVRRGLSVCTLCDEESMRNDRLRLSWIIVAAALIILFAFLLLQRARLASFARAIEHRASLYVVQPVKRRVTLVGGGNNNNAITDTGNKEGETATPPPQLGGKKLNHQTRNIRMSKRLRQVDEKATMLWRVVVSIDSSTTLRILISLFQVIGGMSKTFYELFPSIFHSISQAFNVISAEIFYNIDFACVLRSDHYLSLVMGLIAPLIAFLLLFGAHVVLEARLKNTGREDKVQQLRNGTFQLFLVLLFLIYPGVSNTILNTFACRTFDDGSAYLRKDLTVSCHAPERSMWLGIAAIGVIVYVVGIPCVYFFSLWRVRQYINPPEKNVKPDQSKYNHLLFLTEIYRRDCWWYEVFELLRKLVQTTLIVFVLDGSALQAVVMITVSMLIVNFLNEMRPYLSVKANRLAIVAQWEILICSFLGLLYKVDLIAIDKQWQYDRRAMLDSLLVIALLSTPAFALYQKRAWLFRNFKAFILYVGAWFKTKFSNKEQEEEEEEATNNNVAPSKNPSLFQSTNPVILSERAQMDKNNHPEGFIV